MRWRRTRTRSARSATASLRRPERLRSGVVEDSLADVHVAILLLLFVLTAWAAVPAVGALVFGVWLRRELEAAGGQTPAGGQTSGRDGATPLAQLVPQRRAGGEQPAHPVDAAAGRRR